MKKLFKDPEARFFLTAEAGAGGEGAGGATGAGGGTGGASGGSAGGDRGGTGGGAGGGTAGAGDPWYQPHVATLDKDTLAYLDGKKFPSMVDALKSGAQSDKMARERNVIARPDPAKLGEWEGWGVLGWKPDKSAYAADIKPPKMPNGAEHDAALMDDFVALAHENKIPAPMAEKLFHGLTDKVNGRLGELASQGVKATETLMADLHKEWGPDTQLRTELATRAAKAFGVGADDLSQLEKVTGSPGLLKMFYAIGAKIGEANLVGSDGLGGAAGMTPAAAEAELRRLEGDAEFGKAFRDSRHPQHADTKARWDKLVATAAKGGATQAARR